MIKIVSYSLWGNDPMYLVGAIRNIENIADFLPGWTPRFYCYEDYTDYFSQVTLPYELIRCNDTSGYLKLFGRFQVAFDMTVDRFLVRDSDSRITKRESEAVKEWEQSSYPFHIIRDHPHHKIEILGGLWGMVRGCIDNFYELLDSWLADHSVTNHSRDKYFDSDQQFLKQKVWPLIANNHMAHDNYFKLSSSNLIKKLQIETKYFCGQKYDHKNIPLC